MADEETLDVSTPEIECYINSFYGYGNFNSKVWLIGMEEGGGNSANEVTKRIKNWHLSGRPNLLDNKKHHIEFRAEKFFEGKGVLQPTWNKLIRLVLSYYNEDNITTEKVRIFQKTQLGQANSDNALIELFPLPSPKNSTWKYGKWTDIKYLQKRKTYCKAVAEKRISFIKEKIQCHKPKLMVFYSTQYKCYWKRIIDKEDLEKTEIMGHTISYFDSKDTFYIICQHPCAIRNNKYWHTLGTFAREITNNR